MFRDLFANFATVALCVALLALCQEWIRGWVRLYRFIGVGLFTGCAALATMVMAFPFHDGVIIDLRTVVLGLSGMFGGPLAACVAAAVAGVYRIWLGGGGVPAGVVSILISACAGVLIHFTRVAWHWEKRSVICFATVQALLPVGAMVLLPDAVRSAAITQALAPLMALNLVSALLCAFILDHSSRQGWLVHLLKAAIRQAPDYFYIKDRAGRLVLANTGVVTWAGARTLDEVVGLTDYDLTTPDRADRLFRQEQALIVTGKPLINEEESITAPDGTPRTFVTNKTPIFNRDGTIAGLVGVTRDTTERFELEARLEAMRNELETTLAGMSDGLARFDKGGTLIFFNARYQSLFPLTGHIRQPGITLNDILDEVLRTGEQILGTLDPFEWKQDVLRNTRHGGEEQVKMADGRWLRIRSQPLDDGGSVVIVSDVTAIKLAEEQLSAVAEQFRVLATIDPLTGLQNRRTFDDVLEQELAHSRASRSPLSLLIADIDYFKLYNDTYGHPAGDACLRHVAHALRAASHKVDDLSARYGGEEFAMILPSTNRRDATIIASRIIAEIDRLGMPHRASPLGRISISIGVATIDADVAEAGAQDLLQSADRALYQAKQRGRARLAVA